SASGKTKLFDLQEAAKQFGFHMLCNPHAPVSSSGNCNVEQGTVSISLVPYAEQVTVHNDVFDAVNEAVGSRYDISREHRYSACATFDSEDFGTALLSVSDDIKRTGPFDPWNDAAEPVEDVVCKTDDWRIVRPMVAHHSDLNYLINNLRAGGNTSIDLGMKWGAGLLDPDLRPAMQL
ncbi:hypothetical protein HA397_29790, partial [Escherichia coli]|nr:hypothetical protein [Escherichia coli]